MIMVYVSLLERGLRELDSVPTNLKDEVKRVYNERNPDSLIA